MNPETPHSASTAVQRFGRYLMAADMYSEAALSTKVDSDDSIDGPYCFQSNTKRI
jgi:hypothetical protein